LTVFQQVAGDRKTTSQKRPLKQVSLDSSEPFLGKSRNSVQNIEINRQIPGPHELDREIGNGKIVRESGKLIESGSNAALAVNQDFELNPIADNGYNQC